MVQLEHAQSGANSTLGAAQAKSDDSADGRLNSIFLLLLVRRARAASYAISLAALRSRATDSDGDSDTAVTLPKASR
jgi:hypothetical protein